MSTQDKVNNFINCRCHLNTYILYLNQFPKEFSILFLLYKVINRIRCPHYTSNTKNYPYPCVVGISGT